MTPVFKVLIAERIDISTVTIVCSDCGTEVSFNAEKAAPPSMCSSCSTQFSEHTANALSALIRFHREAKTAEDQSKKTIFRFAIKHL
jgi:hypothetical protein